MKSFILFFIGFIGSVAVIAQTPTDVFFSEYVEGSGNNKALEIYNPTSAAIDLSYYYVLRFSNGNSTFAEGGSTRLSGMLEPYKTFVLVNGQTTSTPTSPACSPELQAMADQLDGVYPAPTYMNGNDAMALVKTPDGSAPDANMSNVTSVDLIGQIGLGALISAETGWSFVQDSTLTYDNGQGTTVTGKVTNYIVPKYATDGSTFGPFWMSWTSNHTLIRRPAVIKGVLANPSPFNVKLEWDTIASVIDSTGYPTQQDIWTDLGRHTCVVSALPENSGLRFISVYPNPLNNDHFTLHSGKLIVEVEVYNLAGQCVYKQSYGNGNLEVNVGPFQLPKGTYLVKGIAVSGLSSTQKLLIY